LVTLPSVTLGKAAKKMRYQVSLPSASTLTLGKAVYTTMCFPALPSARTLALGKEFSKKNIFLCRVPSQLGTRQRIFQKKIFFAECRVRKALDKGFFKKKILCRVPGQEGTRQRIFQKKGKSFAECLPDPALDKDAVNG